MAEEKDFSVQSQGSIAKLKNAHGTLKKEIQKIIVGQEKVIDQVLISIFASGHCLLVGVPGLAKTMLISTLSKALSLKFSRIQFTPDLMPADITGTEVIQEDKTTGQRGFKFLEGPIFANVILADEINRTPPKTQAALLEAMQERQVTAGGKKQILPQPFFVLATQNPIEQEGTYPLPEAQLDRFMFNVLVDYPSAKEELEIMQRTTSDYKFEIQPVLSKEDIIELQDIVRKVPISDHALEYAINFARLTRVVNLEDQEFSEKIKETPDRIKKILEFNRKWIAWGAGPRASQYTILGAKARAILHGRNRVITEDIKAVIHPVLRHRMKVTYAAAGAGITTDNIIDNMIDNIPEMENQELSSDRVAKIIR